MGSLGDPCPAGSPPLPSRLRLGVPALAGSIGSFLLRPVQPGFSILPPGSHHPPPPGPIAAAGLRATLACGGGIPTQGAPPKACIGRHPGPGPGVLPPSGLLRLGARGTPGPVRPAAGRWCPPRMAWPLPGSAKGSSLGSQPRTAGISGPGHCRHPDSLPSLTPVPCPPATPSAAPASRGYPSSAPPGPHRRLLPASRVTLLAALDASFPPQAPARLCPSKRPPAHHCQGWITKARAWPVPPRARLPRLPPLCPSPRGLLPVPRAPRAQSGLSWAGPAAGRSASACMLPGPFPGSFLLSADLQHALL